MKNKVFHLIADVANGVQMIKDMDLFSGNQDCDQLSMQDFYDNLDSCGDYEQLVSVAIDISNQELVDKIKAEYGISNPY